MFSILLEIITTRFKKKLISPVKEKPMNKPKSATDISKSRYEILKKIFSCDDNLSRILESVCKMISVCAFVRFLQIVDHFDGGNMIWKSWHTLEHQLESTSFRLTTSPKNDCALQYFFIFWTMSFCQDCMQLFASSSIHFGNFSKFSLACAL